jgi:hypothetical protein
MLADDCRELMAGVLSCGGDYEQRTKEGKRKRRTKEMSIQDYLLHGS